MFAMFKGDHGAGKSVAALSFPNPIVFDFDKKGDAIARKHFPGKPVMYRQFGDVLEAGEMLQHWLQVGCPFETVIIDSITSLSYAILKSLDDAKGQNVLRSLENVRESAKKNKTAELRGYDYYNFEDNFLKFFIDSLKDLWIKKGNPRHVIVIAHVLTSESQDIRTKEITQTRQIVTAGKKIAAYIPAQFDDAYHFGIEPGSIMVTGGPKVAHFAVTEGIGVDFAKTSYDLPYKIDYTKGSFYELIRDIVDPENGTPSSQSTQPEIISKPAKLIL